jgi:hypothetical protein
VAARRALPVAYEALHPAAWMSLVAAAQTAWLLAIRANQSPDDAAAAVIRDAAFSWGKTTKPPLASEQVRPLLEVVLTEWLQRFAIASADKSRPSIARFQLPQLYFDTSEWHRVYANDDQLGDQARHLTSVAYPARFRDDHCIAAVPYAVLQGVLVLTDMLQAPPAQRSWTVFGKLEPQDDTGAILDRVLALESSAVDPTAVLQAARHLAA